MIRRDSATRYNTMNVGSIPGMLDGAADERLEPRTIRRIFGTDASHLPKYSILAQETRKSTRGWLTPFQATQIARGRGDSLFVGSYVLLDLLGGGGMGHVFRATQTSTKLSR